MAFLVETSGPFLHAGAPARLPAGPRPTRSRPRRRLAGELRRLAGTRSAAAPCPHRVDPPRPRKPPRMARRLHRRGPVHPRGSRSLPASTSAKPPPGPRPPQTVGGEGDTTPQLLVTTYPPTQDLEKPVAGKIWNALPATRATDRVASRLRRPARARHQWRALDARFTHPAGETTGFASWYADLWMQEPITLRAFHSRLLHLRRFFGVAAGETLAALFAESARDQQEVTDQLAAKSAAPWKCSSPLLIRSTTTRPLPALRRPGKGSL